MQALAIQTLLVICVCSYAVYSHYLEDKLKTLFHRNDLTCPYWCASMRCCICRSFLYNRITKEMGMLSVMYEGSEVKVCNIGASREHYYLIHRHGHLLKIPENICDFQKIIKVDLSFNKISELKNISCLEHLDTLILKGNLIRYLSNETFLQMKYIRIIDLSYNEIQYMEPGFPMIMDGSLFKFNISHNNLETLDVTNGLWTKQKYFCYTDFSYNHVQSLTNVLNWKFGLHTDFGYGGYVDISYNEMTTFVDYRDLGFPSLLSLGKLISYGIDIRHNPLNCDCKVYSFAKAARDIALKIFRDYFTIICHGPPHLKNRTLVDIVLQKQFKSLICEIKANEKCPLRCHCVYQPAVRNRTMVNCSDKHLTRLPSSLPEYESIELDFSNNELTSAKQYRLQSKISTGKSQTYFSRLQKFNLSNNSISFIPNDILYSWRNIKLIDLRDNRILKLQRSYQILSPCQLHLGKIIMECKCDDMWLQQWLPAPHKKCHKNIEILCRTKGFLTPVTAMTKEGLGCRLPEGYILWISNMLISSFVAMAVCTFVIYFFRFEIFIILRDSIKRCFKQRAPDTLTYDVYISCNDQLDSIRIWLMSTLIPYLERNDLKIFFPCRDSVVGDARETEMIEVISNSRCFMIILCDDYPGQIRWHEKEWKYAWFNYINNMNREMVIVNYDMLTCNEMAKRYLGAFLRLGKFIDFSNQRKSIEKDIYNRVKILSREKNIKFVSEYGTFPLSELESKPIGS